MTGSDLLHSTSGQWTVVRCDDCGLVFTNPRPTAETIANVYPLEYAPHHAKSNRKNKLAHPLQMWALRNFWNYQPAHSSFLGKIISWPFLLWFKTKSRNFGIFPFHGEGKLLDYGCGGGSYLSRMRDFGWQVTGMDMSPAAVEECQKQNLNATVGIAPDQTFEPATFDVVTLWHVLEHVPSPTQTLKQIHTILKPGGKFVLASPNYQTWLRSWLGNCWYPIDLPRHLTHFGKTTIKEMLEKNGFKVEKIQAQRHGQITQRSVKYLADKTGKKRYRFLARSRTLCSFIEALSFLTANPSRMIVHARKIQN